MMLRCFIYSVFSPLQINKHISTSVPYVLRTFTLFNETPHQAYKTVPDCVTSQIKLPNLSRIILLTHLCPINRHDLAASTISLVIVVIQFTFIMRSDCLITRSTNLKLPLVIRRILAITS